MLRSLKNPHIGAQIRAFKITTTATPSVSIDIGAGDVASSSRVSAGIATIVPAKPLIRSGPTLLQAFAAAAGAHTRINTTSTGALKYSQLRTFDGSALDGTVFMLALDFANEFTDRTGSQLQGVTNSARSARLMGFKISSAGAAAIGGTQSSAVAKASSVYTTTFTRAFGRDCMAWCTPIAAAQKNCIVTTVSASACSVATYSAAEAAEDNSFYMFVLGWDAKDENYGMTKAIQVPQLKPRLESFRIQGTGTAAIIVGDTDATLVDNDTGDYTLTWNTPFAREPIVQVSSKNGRGQCLAAATTTTARVGSFDESGTAQDAELDVVVLGYSSSMEL